MHIQKAAELKANVDLWTKKILELEASAAPLREDLARAQEQERAHSEALAQAQAEAARLLTEYRAECRKLATGKDSDALDLKIRLDRAEAKVEGLKQLLEDDQREVARAEGALAEPNSALASAKASEREASVLLQVAKTREAIAEKLSSLVAEVNRGLEDLCGAGADGPSRDFVRTQHWYVVTLKNQLQMAAQFFC